MKKDKIIYWATTGIISLMMLFAAFSYFTDENVKNAMGTHLGFPDYFRVELGIAKVLGALALILPMVPTRLKEFAYFGFALTFVSAFYAHLSSGDPLAASVGPIVFLGVLAVSYVYFQKRTSLAQP